MASICRYLINFNKTHPLKNGTGVLVDYNIASLMLPMIVVGATTGVMLNKILPPIVVSVIFTILLVYFNIMTLLKLLKIIADERQKFGPVCCGGTQDTSPDQITAAVSASSVKTDGQKSTNQKKETEMASMSSQK